MTAVAGPAANGQAASQPAAAPASHPATHATTPKAVPPLASRQCIRDTGSHIPPPKGQCLPVAGTSYSQQDLRRTGAIDVGRALQMLDPSVTVHGH
ncbi:MAG: hypothetical protein EPN38_01625 [Rhodanobacteraceae bacterium]|nr:MAG: hypothetical protein EPN38_01625 [Rhodanobacteraceae bacterium]